jgi:hypothetical protein
MDLVELEVGMPLDDVLVSVELLVVGDKGGSGDVLLVVVGEGFTGDKLLFMSSEGGGGALLRLLHLLGGAVVGVNGGAVDGQCNGLPGLVVVEGALEAVSVSVELLSLGSLGLYIVFTSILLDSAWVFSDTVTVVLWDLARAVLVAMISRSVGALLSVLLAQQLLRLEPGPAWS